jgi:DnaK suppressor protein
MKETNKTKANRSISMREKKIQEVKKKLLKQKEALLSEADDARNSLPEERVFPELGDQASAEIDKNFMLRLRGRERQLLKKIDEAIDKIESGTYGICEACGEDINIKRLEARPVTTMCIECKTEQEEEEKMRER